MVTMWLPVIWDDEQKCWRADLPVGRAAEIPGMWDEAGGQDSSFVVTAEAELPVSVNHSAEIPSAWNDLAGRWDGKPAVQFCRVRVDDADAPKITNAVAEKDVPESDRLLVNLCALPFAYDKTAADVFFNALAVNTIEQKTFAAKLLLYAVRIRLHPAKASEIAGRLDTADDKV